MAEGQKKKSGKSIVVDLTKPRDRRPLTGLDIEQWRGEMNLSKYDALHALGFRNTNHYNSECQRPLLRFETELLIRIYMEYPGARAWEQFELPELFALMYAGKLEPFHGREDEPLARVDLEDRFTMLFDRSRARKYEWLRPRSDKAASASTGIEAILSKLKVVPNPTEVLEQVAAQVHSLRGIDLDRECPIPTLARPPKREKTGRRAAVKPAPAPAPRPAPAVKATRSPQPAAKKAKPAARPATSAIKSAKKSAKKSTAKRKAR